MKESNYAHHGNEGLEHSRIEHASVPPYWRMAHHDWRFWVGLMLMLAAITIYVMSEDLAWLPHG
jgi:hypothetical protein